jgi:hypothetical protein
VSAPRIQDSPARRAPHLFTLALLLLVLGCDLRPFAGDPKTSGDDPRVNTATSAPAANVPYCPGGNRASTCVFGANCRVTEDNCQVCQCLNP